MSSLVVSPQPPDAYLERRSEWIVTNGLGGYASGLIFGSPTRRFHGLLVAAMPSPLGRMMMLHDLSESLRLPDGQYRDLQRFEPVTGGDGDLARDTVRCRLDLGLPVWTFRSGPVCLEKRIALRHWQNTSQLTFTLREAQQSIRLRLRPWLNVRAHEARLDREAVTMQIMASGARVEFAFPAAPTLRLRIEPEGGALVLDTWRTETAEYPLERARGYDFQERVWSPGYFRVWLEPLCSVSLVASTEPWEDIEAVSSVVALEAEQHRRLRLIQQAHRTLHVPEAESLVLAADHFIVRPVTRRGDTATAQFAGEDARTIIAGYHWFTDWGRDAMIALEGLTLATGRLVEARYLLQTFARYVRDGLLPNNFPEGEERAVYHTADATLWYFHALGRYLAACGDRQFVTDLLPMLKDIVAWHLKGTHFGIHVDPHDGLLVQGASEFPLTWMDAKVGDWIVTPRRGKAVEINALWYNALRHVAAWLPTDDDYRRVVEAEAERVWRSFNERFWNERHGILWDVVDGEHGNDDALRPNQIFAISLDHPVLEPSRWAQVVQTVERELLTPYGLRTLHRGHPGYRATYDGDVRARDAAYHQGSVWPWLVGHFVDAWLRVFPHRRDEAARMIDRLVPRSSDGCVGTICELFDAEPPYLPRGCASQAWSVAEVMRVWVRCRCDEPAR